MLGSIMAYAQPAGDVAGVQLITPKMPSFDGHVRSVLGSRELGPAFQELLRHTAVLVNHSGKTVVGYGVAWRYEEHGAVRNARHWGQDPVPTGRSRLVSTAAIVGEATDEAFTQLMELRARRALEVVGQWSDPVETTLDWIHLDDGTVYGPDTQGVFAALMARAKAPHAFADEVLETAGKGGDIGVFLAEAASQRASQHKDPWVYYRTRVAREFLATHGQGGSVSDKAREVKGRDFQEPRRGPKGGVQ